MLFYEKGEEWRERADEGYYPYRRLGDIGAVRQPLG